MNTTSSPAGKTIRRELYRLLVAVLFVQTAYLGTAWAHKGQHHEVKSMPAKKSATEADMLVKINEEYLRTIRPIFQKSCFDCHSTVASLPWYHQIPGVKQLMDYDMRESKVHLDMTGDFPFAGHGSPTEDLEAIAEVLEKGTMPPVRYRLLHGTSAVTPEERKLIEGWLKMGQQKLSEVETKEQKE